MVPYRKQCSAPTISPPSPLITAVLKFCCVKEPSASPICLAARRSAFDCSLFYWDCAASAAAPFLPWAITISTCSFVTLSFFEALSTCTARRQCAREGDSVSARG